MREPRHQIPSSRRRRATRIVILSLLSCASLPVALAHEATATLHVRNDEDSTTIVSPRARARADVGDASRVELVYTADVWTSASIDIRTAASRVITERRDELSASIGHTIDATTLGGGYRYSTEIDYVSHAGSASVSHDFAQRSATVAVAAYAAKDVVGREGDPSFDRGLGSFGTQLTFSQVLDPDTLAQAGYEVAYLSGYQASPYRFVGIDGLCDGTALQCVPERVPDRRVRHALLTGVRRALGSRWSAGLSYRYYLDGWQLSSHTIEPVVALTPVDEALLSLRYRFYQQTAASFYRSAYESQGDIRFVTRDRKLSPLQSHRISLDYEHDVALGDAWELQWALVAGVSLYRYHDFPGLTDVGALELSAAVGMEL